MAVKRDEKLRVPSLYPISVAFIFNFYDPPNFLKKRDAPNRVVTTSRKGFQNFKEIRVFHCAKADRDRKFRNLENMVLKAETVFPLAETCPVPLISGNRVSFSGAGRPIPPVASFCGRYLSQRPSGRLGAALVRPRARTRNRKFDRVVTETIFRSWIA